MPPKAPKAAPVKEMAPCAICKAEVEKDEGLCSGCGHVVCAACDTAQPWGRHTLDEHRA